MSQNREWMWTTSNAVVNAALATHVTDEIMSAS